MGNVQALLTVIFTVSLSFLAVFIGVLLNNARLGDLRDSMRAEMKASHAETRQQLAEQIADLKLLLGELRVLIEKNHSETLVRFADIENRFTRLEAERRVVQ